MPDFEGGRDMIEFKGSNIRMTRGNTMSASITIKDAQGRNFTVNAHDIKLTTAAGDEDTFIKGDAKHKKVGDIK